MASRTPVRAAPAAPALVAPPALVRVRGGPLLPAAAGGAGLGGAGLGAAVARGAGSPPGGGRTRSRRQRRQRK